MCYCRSEQYTVTHQLLHLGILHWTAVKYNAFYRKGRQYFSCSQGITTVMRFRASSAVWHWMHARTHSSCEIQSRSSEAQTRQGIFLTGEVSHSHATGSHGVKDSNMHNTVCTVVDRIVLSFSLTGTVQLLGRQTGHEANASKNIVWWFYPVCGSR